MILNPRIYTKPENLKLNFKLSENEQKIINLLRKFHADTSSNTIMRIAGGWVRDKVISL